MDLKVGNGKYKIIKKIKTGSFGETYLGIHIKTNEQFAIKLEYVNSRTPMLIWEAKIYKILSGGVGIPNVYWIGREGDYNVMIFELLGQSLEDYFLLCKKKFSLKTILLLADGILQRIEYIHSKNFLHRDIKPEHLLVGLGKKQITIYTIGFALAKRFIDPKTKAHIPYRDGKSFTGTIKFASLNANLGIELSRRDDLENIGFVLMHLIGRIFPWRGLSGKTRKDKNDLIKQVKANTRIENLCKGNPQEFAIYLNYCRNLKFDEKPDYGFLRKLFKDLFFLKGYEYDYLYDWLLPNVPNEYTQTQTHDIMPAHVEDKIMNQVEKKEDIKKVENINKEEVKIKENDTNQKSLNGTKENFGKIEILQSQTKIVYPAQISNKNDKREIFSIPVLSIAGSEAYCKVCTEESKIKKPIFAHSKYITEFAEIINLIILTNDSKIKWEDLVGLEDVKKKMIETIVLPFKNKALFTGLRTPSKGILLFGPQGNGKTMVAKGVASQCGENLTFFNLNAGKFSSNYYGDSQKFIKAIFATAYERQPAVIFIDDLDSIIFARPNNENEASRRLKVEFLVLFDELVAHQDDLVVIGSSNRPFDIDNAVLKRFSTKIFLPLPILIERQQMLTAQLNKVKNKISTEEIQDIAKSTEGFSFADLKALCQEAAMEPIRCIDYKVLETLKSEEAPPIIAKHFEIAKKKVAASVSQKLMLEFDNWNKENLKL